MVLIAKKDTRMVQNFDTINTIKSLFHRASQLWGLGSSPTPGTMHAVVMCTVIYHDPEGSMTGCIVSVVLTIENHQRAFTYFI